MKKIIILIFIIINSIYGVRGDFLDYQKCPHLDQEYCTENYYIKDISVFQYKFEDGYIKGNLLLDKPRNDYLIKNILNIKYNYYNPYIENIYELKYNNHVIYNVVLNEYYEKDLEQKLNKEEIKKFNIELYEKYKDKLGLYIDDKKIGEYIIDGRSNYKNIDHFFIKNKIMFFDEDIEYYDNYIYQKSNYILKEKTLKKLDDFVEKVEKINYDKEKLLKKIDIIYNEYKEKSGSKNKFISEALLYLHTEILINKLKQNEELETLKF